MVSEKNERIKIKRRGIRQRTKRTRRNGMKKNMEESKRKRESIHLSMVKQQV